MEAVDIMLFLKYVESIEVLRWEEGASQPELHFSCSARNTDAGSAQKRALFVQASQVRSRPSLL